MNIVIIEDEILIAQGLMRNLKDYFGLRIKHLDHCSQLEEAIEKIQTRDVDLVLLDLNLFGQDGFDILQLTNASSFHTIVVSAYADLAIRAFEFGVLDFVAKPFTQERLTKALQRFDNKSSDHPFTQSLAVKKLGQLQLLAIKDINYVQADGHYSQIWMINGSSHLHDKSIERLLHILPDYFLRTHRSYAINLHQVKQINIETGGKYFVDTLNSVSIPLSRSYYASVKKAWNIG
jgi:two-component system response regulator LytT